MKILITLVAMLLPLSACAESDDMKSTLQQSETAICRDNPNKEKCIVTVQRLMYAVSKVTELNDNCKSTNGNVGIQAQCRQSEQAIGYINSLDAKR